MIQHITLNIQTKPREILDITADVQSLLKDFKKDALVNVFIHHTSASIMLSEHYDPDVLADLSDFMGRLVKDGDKAYRHTLEGPDDMSAHIRSVLTHSSISVPVSAGKLMLGQWAGIFLWEHRTKAHQRILTITIID